MSILNTSLDALFGRWISAIAVNEGKYDEDVLFSKDGLMYKNDVPFDVTDKEWRELSKRVMFIAKDNNATWSDDTRLWLKSTSLDTEKNITDKKKNRRLENPFLKRVAFLLWGLHKINHTQEWWYGELKAHYQEMVDFFNECQFAFVEAKKQPGGSSISDKTLSIHLTKYGSFLGEEIEILNPNYIVCFGPVIFGYVLSMYAKKGELRQLNKNLYLAIDREQQIQRVILYASHPRDRRYSDKEYYEDNIYWIRDYLKEI